MDYPLTKQAYTGLAFAQFKANQSLSHKEICQIFGCDLTRSKEWAQGYAPAHINEIAILLNKVLEFCKQKNMSDTDSQYFEKEKSKVVKENEELKLRISRAILALSGDKKTTNIKSDLKMIE